MRKLLYFLIALLPFRIAINILIALAIVSAGLQFTAYYINNNPKEIEKLLQEKLPLELSIKKIHANYDLVNFSFNFEQINLKKPQEKHSISIKSLHISIQLLSSLFTLKPRISQLYIDQAHLSYYSEQTLPSPPKNKAFVLNNALDKVPHWLLLVKSFKINDSQLNFLNTITKQTTASIANLTIEATNSRWKHDIQLTGTYRASTLLNTHAPMKSQSSKQIAPTKFNLSANLIGNSEQISNWSGDFHLSLNNLSYHYIKNSIDKKFEEWLFDKNYQIHGGQININTWGSFSEQKLSKLLGDIDINHLKMSQIEYDDELLVDQLKTKFKLNTSTSLLQSNHLKNPISSQFKLELLDTNLSINQSKNTELKKINLPLLSLHLLHGQSTTKVHAYFPTFYLKDLNRLISFISPESQTKLNLLQPETKFEQVHAQLQLNPNSHQLLKVYAEIKNYTQQLSKNYPLIKNLSANLWFMDNLHLTDDQTMTIQLKSKDFMFQDYSLFRSPLYFNQLDGFIFWKQINKQHWIKLTNTKISNDHLSLWADADIWANQDFASPYVSAKAQFEQVKVKNTPTYLPVGIMDKSLIEWLDPAIVDGIVPHGNLLLRGRLNTFPFEQHQGLMDIVFDTKAVDLNYVQNWPVLKNISSQIQFTETGMHIIGSHAQMYSARTPQTRVDLDHYETDDILISSLIYATLKDSAQFLDMTQLISPMIVNKLKNNSKGSGQVKLNLKLTIPTDDKSISTNIAAEIKGEEYSPSWLNKQKIEEIEGQLNIKNQEITSLNLAGKLDNQSIKVRLKTENINRGMSESMPKDSNKPYFIAETQINSALLHKINLIPNNLLPLLDYFHGSAPVIINLSPSWDDRPEWTIDIQSNLKGMQIDLPQPLKKAALSSKYFKLSFNHYETHQISSLNYSDRFNWCGYFPTLSSTKKLSNKETHQFYMSAKHSQFSPPICAPSNNSLSLYGDWIIKETKPWQQLIENFSPKTTQVLKKDSSHPSISLKLSSLHLPKPIKTATTNERAKVSQIKPTNESIVLFDGTIKKLLVDKIDFGKFSFFSKVLPNGNINQSLKITGDLINASIEGYTLHSDNKVNTQLNSSVSILDTGKFLRTLNYYDSLTKTPLNLQGKLFWPGSFRDFDFERIKGNLSFETKPGNLNQIDTGAAKILSLLNLGTIKNSLKKDYNDLPNQGFTFDSIKGELLFNQGILQTKNINILSNIATINVNGEINLSNAILNEKVIVTPKISSSLTYAGLLIAGPSGAAIGWIGKQLLGEQLNKMTQYEYQMQGTFEDPIIINKNKAKKQTTQKNRGAKNNSKVSREK